MSATQSDEVRFETLFNSFSPQVYAYLKRRTDVANAQDATAETFLVAWRRLHEIPDSERALAWLYGVARRVLANQRRSVRRLGRLVDRIASLEVQSTPSPESAVVSRLEGEQLVQALRRLPERQQELLRLAAWEELPHAQIAATLDCTPHAVDQRLYRATRRLAKELAATEYKNVRNATPDTTVLGDAP